MSTKYMVKVNTFLFLLLLGTSLHVSAFERFNTSESLFIVLSNPEDFYGKKLVVSGFISGQGLIFPTKELSKFGVNKNGLLIDTKDKELQKKINLKQGYGFVSGYLCKTRDVNPFPYLCNIDRIDFKDID